MHMNACKRLKLAPPRAAPLTHAPSDRRIACLDRHRQIFRHLSNRPLLSVAGVVQVVLSTNYQSTMQGSVCSSRSTPTSSLYALISVMRTTSRGERRSCSAWQRCSGVASLVPLMHAMYGPAGMSYNLRHYRPSGWLAPLRVLNPDLMV